MARGINLIAGRLDRARAHPAPDQNHVLVRRVVEAVPAAARRIDHIALPRWLVALVGIDVTVTLQDDEELIAIMVPVTLMAGAGLQHGPANHMVCAGRFLVDQELHLHLDPAVLARETFDLGYIAEIGAI